MEKIEIQKENRAISNCYAIKDNKNDKKLEEMWDNKWDWRYNKQIS
jgi:hypothetical protein